MIFKFKSDKEKPMIGQIRIISSFCILPKIIDGHFIWLENVYIQYEYQRVKHHTDPMEEFKYYNKWVPVKFSTLFQEVRITDKERLYNRTKK